MDSPPADQTFFLTDDNFGLNFRTDPDYCAELFEALRKEKLHS